MKKFNLFNLFFNSLFVAFAVFSAFSTIRAQDAPTPSEAPKGEFRRGRERPNLFRELGLTREQIEQIKQLNTNRRPLQQQAQQRVRETTRNLDQAIYADAVNESEIQARLKELQAAQAEIARLRATSELEVRKILTAEQLVKFRDLRRRFAERRENFRNERRDAQPDENKNAPSRRFNRQLRRFPNN